MRKKIISLTKKITKNVFFFWKKYNSYVEMLSFIGKPRNDSLLKEKLKQEPINPEKVLSFYSP